MNLTSLGVMTTDMTTPSSSSLASGAGTNTGSDGNKPAWRHTYIQQNRSNIIFSIEVNSQIDLI